MNHFITILINKINNVEMRFTFFGVASCHDVRKHFLFPKNNASSVVRSRFINSFI